MLTDADAHRLQWETKVTLNVFHPPRRWFTKIIPQATKLIKLMTQASRHPIFVVEKSGFGYWIKAFNIKKKWILRAKKQQNSECKMTQPLTPNESIILKSRWQNISKIVSEKQQWGAHKVHLLSGSGLLQDKNTQRYNSTTLHVLWTICRMTVNVFRIKKRLVVTYLKTTRRCIEIYLANVQRELIHKQERSLTVWQDRFNALKCY